MTACPSPWQILWDTGESMIALTTHGAESTSPYPTIPSSVKTLMMTPSWALSLIFLISPFCRTGIASTFVIFTFPPLIFQSSVSFVQHAAFTCIYMIHFIDLFVNCFLLTLYMFHFFVDDHASMWEDKEESLHDPIMRS